MATQTIPNRSRNSNDAQTRREEALRIAKERLAALTANLPPVTEIFYATNPGPDFTPKAWR